MLTKIIEEAFENAYDNGYLDHMILSSAIDLVAELYEHGVITKGDIIPSVKIIQELKDAKDSVFGY